MQDRFRQLESAIARASPSDKRTKFLDYCEAVIKAVATGTLAPSEGAYRIVGASAHIVDRLLPADRHLLAIGPGSRNLSPGRLTF